MPERIAVILAGGKSVRMGADKATLVFRGERLVDRVVRRLRPQADRLIISGASDYGLNLECLADADEFPAGPAAGVLSVARRLASERDVRGFVTAPVDGPFVPPDLVERLGQSGGCATAADRTRLHPTFACWRVAGVEAVATAFVAGKDNSLMRLASLVEAKRVEWADADAFANLNSKADLIEIESLAADERS